MGLFTGSVLFAFGCKILVFDQLKVARKITFGAMLVKIIFFLGLNLNKIEIIIWTYK